MTSRPAPLYDDLGVGYRQRRRPDPRIARAVEAALGPGRVVNVGAGAGSYEPAGCVVAVEPSRVMIAQRPAGAASCVQARAEQLPFADGAFDAALAVLTLHHWDDPATGLRELRRVSRRQVVLTWDPSVSQGFWLLRDYFPEIPAAEAGLAALPALLAAWPAAVVRVVPVPADCVDGFLAAYWHRPAEYLEPAARAAISAFARLPDEVLQRGLARLRADLDSGRWEERNAELLGRPELDCGYRLVVNGPAA